MRRSAQSASGNARPATVSSRAGATLFACGSASLKFACRAPNSEPRRIHLEVKVSRGSAWLTDSKLLPTLHTRLQSALRHCQPDAQCSQATPKCRVAATSPRTSRAPVPWRSRTKTAIEKGWSAHTRTRSPDPADAIEFPRKPRSDLRSRCCTDPLMPCTL